MKAPAVANCLGLKQSVPIPGLLSGLLEVEEKMLNNLVFYSIATILSNKHVKISSKIFFGEKKKVT